MADVAAAGGVWFEIVMPFLITYQLQNGKPYRDNNPINPDSDAFLITLLTRIAHYA